MSSVAVRAVGVCTGWGDGVQALPEDAAVAARGRTVVTLATPARAGDRFRRATRECLLGLAAVEALLREAGLGPGDIGGDGTALVYATAAAYAAANRAFIDAAQAAGALHFPYTAPSAVPAEVAIEYRLTGPYATLIGGRAATLDALWHATGMLRRGECDRALVLSVETFAECADLWARGRWLVGVPLVEAAACALLGPEDGDAARGWRIDQELEALARRRAGQTLGCGPLIALALAEHDRRAVAPAPA